jgi:hypothetical protein
VVEVQRAPSHQPFAGEASGRFLTLGLQMVQSGNLLDGMHSGPHHGEFASECRIRPGGHPIPGKNGWAHAKDRQLGEQNPKVFRPQ